MRGTRGLRRLTAERAAHVLAAAVLAASAAASVTAADVATASAADGLIVTSVDRAQSPGAASAPPRDVLVVRVANPTRIARHDAVLLLFRDRDRDGRYSAKADRLLLRHTLRTPVAAGASGVEVVPLEHVIAERTDGALLVAQPDDAAGADRAPMVAARRSTPAVECCAKRGLTALALDEHALSIATPVQNQIRQSSAWTADAGHVTADAGGGLVLLHREDEAFDVEIRIMFPRGASNDAGILFGFRHPRHWYQLRVDAKRMRLMRVRGDSMRTLASGTVDLRPGRWYTLRAQVRKLGVAGFVDDRQALAFDGPADARGAVGVMQDGGVRVRYASIVHTPHQGTDRPREDAAKP